MTTVITYGTFDLFHLGHVRLLKRLSALGDRLIVGCSTDEFNAGKGKRSVMSFEHRCEILESCRFVDTVRLHDKKTSGLDKGTLGFLPCFYNFR